MEISGTTNELIYISGSPGSNRSPHKVNRTVKLGYNPFEENDTNIDDQLEKFLEENITIVEDSIPKGEARLCNLTIDAPGPVYTKRTMRD